MAIHAYVFPSYKHHNKPRSASTDGIRNAINRAGLNTNVLLSWYGPFTVHCLRHTFASKLAQGKMSLFGVGTLLGHSDIKTTQRYAHLVIEDVSDEAVSILENR